MKEERKKYERPSMKRNLVELEDGFCAGSVVTTGNNQVETTGHELNDIDFNLKENSIMFSQITHP